MNIDPKIVEKAAKAVGTTSRLAAIVMFSDKADEFTKAEIRALYVGAARVALEAVADDLRAEGAVKALRDEYHTLDELYEYRMLYNALAANAMPDRAVKSWRHGDGEECFGGGWFVVYLTLPSGQVSNHYKAEHWDLFQVPEVDLAPAWDGHTPAVAAQRLYEAVRADQIAGDDQYERLITAALEAKEAGRTEKTFRELPLHRTEEGQLICSTCDGGGCLDCTDPA